MFLSCHRTCSVATHSVLLALLQVDVVVILFGFPGIELVLERRFIVLDSLCDIFKGHVVVDCREFNVDTLGLCNFVRVNTLVFRLNFIFSSEDVDDFLDVKAFQKVISNDVRGANDNIIYIFHCQGHQETLLHTLEGIFLATIILDHFIVPQADIEEVTLCLCSLQSLDHTRVHQVTAGLKVNDVLVSIRLSAVGEVCDTSRCLQECLLRRVFKTLSAHSSCLGLGLVVE